MPKKLTLLGANAAVTAGTAICNAAKRATEQNPGAENASSRHAARGTCIYAIDNLWYDGMTEAAKQKYNYDRDAFYKACGWPD